MKMKNPTLLDLVMTLERRSKNEPVGRSELCQLLSRQWGPTAKNTAIRKLVQSALECGVLILACDGCPTDADVPTTTHEGKDGNTFYLFNPHKAKEVIQSLAAVKTNPSASSSSPLSSSVTKPKKPDNQQGMPLLAAAPTVAKLPQVKSTTTTTMTTARREKPNLKALLRAMELRVNNKKSPTAVNTFTISKAEVFEAILKRWPNLTTQQRRQLFALAIGKAGILTLDQKVTTPDGNHFYAFSTTPSVAAKVPPTAAVVGINSNSRVVAEKDNINLSYTSSSSSGRNSDVVSMQALIDSLVAVTHTTTSTALQQSGGQLPQVAGGGILTIGRSQLFVEMRGRWPKVDAGELRKMVEAALSSGIITVKSSLPDGSQIYSCYCQASPPPPPATSVAAARKESIDQVLSNPTSIARRHPIATSAPPTEGTAENGIGGAIAGVVGGGNCDVISPAFGSCDLCGQEAGTARLLSNRELGQTRAGHDTTMLPSSGAMIRCRCRSCVWSVLSVVGGTGDDEAEEKEEEESGLQLCASCYHGTIHSLEEEEEAASNSSSISDFLNVEEEVACPNFCANNRTTEIMSMDSSEKENGEGDGGSSGSADGWAMV